MAAISAESGVTQATLAGSGPWLACAAPVPIARTEALRRYKLRSLLGHGGMGLVYDAVDVARGTHVAVKVLRPELLDAEGQVERFHQEARCLAALSGDHVVRALDAGWLESGAPFLAMERLIGQDLGALVKACGRLAAPVAVDYVLDACAGLVEAHSLGLIHCDIKPSNLFLAARRFGAPRVKVLDFGIARWIGGTAAKRDPAGDDLQVLGSPSYCSPEQLHGAARLDERTDIWSVGVVLFELLTGISPYSRRSLFEIRSRILLEPPPRVRALRPDIPARLASVVDRCLQKAPHLRFASVQDLVDALLPFASRDSMRAPS